MALRYWPEPSIRRKDSSRDWERSPFATAASNAHSGAVVMAATAGAVFSDSPQIVEGGDDPVAADYDLSPKDRTPGVSITQELVESGSRSAMAEDEMCRPRPVTTFTAPIASIGARIKALTSVDFPTPE